MGSRVELSGVEMNYYETERPITVWYELDGREPIIKSIEGVKITKEDREKYIQEIKADLKEQGEEMRLEQALEMEGE